MKRISGGQLSPEAKPRFYQVTPAVLGRRRATQALPVRPGRVDAIVTVSPPPPRGPTGPVGRHRPGEHSDSDNRPDDNQSGAPHCANLQARPSRPSARSGRCLWVGVGKDQPLVSVSFRPNAARFSGQSPSNRSAPITLSHALGSTAMYPATNATGGCSASADRAADNSLRGRHKSRDSLCHDCQSQSRPARSR
jgi:hypothetical protein